MFYEYEIQQNWGYGDGWECVCTEVDHAEAKQRLREYRENQPEAPVRLRRVRVTA